MSADEGLVHLQAAAKEMVAAARSLLDAVEDVVNDDVRLGRVVSNLSDLFEQATHVVSTWSERAGSGSGGARSESDGETRVRHIVVD